MQTKKKHRFAYRFMRLFVSLQHALSFFFSSFHLKSSFCTFR